MPLRSFISVKPYPLSGLHQIYYRPQLIGNHPSVLEDLLSCYNSTLSDLLDIHAQLTTKQYSHAANLWFTTYFQAFTTLRRRLEHNYTRATDPASTAKTWMLGEGGRWCLQENADKSVRMRKMKLWGGRSGFTKHHSIETLPVSLYNKQGSEISQHQVCCSMA